MNISGRIYAALADISGLSLFINVRESPVLANLRTLLEDMAGDRDDSPVFEEAVGALDIIQDWAAFTGSFILCQRDYSFYLTVAWLALTDDNPYTQAAERAETLPPVLAAMAKADLARLGRIADFDIRGLGFYIADILRKNGLEQNALSVEEESRVFWAASRPAPAARGPGALSCDAGVLLRIFPEDGNWALAMPAIGDYLRTFGAGLLGQFDSFYWTFPQAAEGTGGAPVFPWYPAPGLPSGGAPAFLSYALRPVLNPDPVTLDDLCGYEDQRNVVIANTLQFLEGRAANNLLLYGDRGTGKSATVKAVCREFANQGLKLLETGKADLSDLPVILGLLAARSQKFVLFIDDLSFETTDDSFRSLKALLEGGIEARPSNVVVYATSNRRHLVKERTADRPATAEAAHAAASGDVRAFDTMQEQFSLSDRFGLTVVFIAPGQEEYLAIAEHIAIKRGVLSPAAGEESEERRVFRENALRWERWFNGRSPRTAVQYVDWLTSSHPAGTIPEAPGFARKAPLPGAGAELSAAGSTPAAAGPAAGSSPGTAGAVGSSGTPGGKSGVRLLKFPWE
ncbi:MAG: ATP-binding protein [Spirochaetaceae bacterium]|jgi:predicted AAA+ superfamily ATPase|nr:ATP-binding protein [Spirochaetaceae bacterium]